MILIILITIKIIRFLILKTLIIIKIKNIYKTNNKIFNINNNKI